ncbi:MAG: 4-(cytidine 5'-diphospho)-2-C-methyl-D-erythritol kinase [Candidatus Improbicoccus devescovinae]|nr:MAG: 4-(cytidine 5'-diphospho)-2-C-methyl-D-erythritol kinase [Candidatus Improbicoccus devescovinae]
MNNKQMILKAYAKINLGLEILNKNNNNFHEISTITQSINLFDIIKLSNNKSGIKIFCNKYISSFYDNIAYISAKKFFDFVNNKHKTQYKNINIQITKNIPMQAGLGGGSADAGAILLGLNKFFNTNLTKKELLNIAHKIGSDVPLCMTGGTLLVEGTGEKITKMRPIKDIFLFIIIPKNTKISTREAYDIYDRKILKYKNNMFKQTKRINLLKNIIEYDNIRKIFVFCFNDFEKVINLGFNDFKLTGSGSAKYKIFFSENIQEILNYSKKNSNLCENTFICSPVNYGVEMFENCRN